MGIWALVGLLMFVFGFLIVFYALKSGRKQPKRKAHSATTASKNGLPVTPRDARTLPDDTPTPTTPLTPATITADPDMASKITITTAQKLSTPASTPKTSSSEQPTPPSQTKFTSTVAEFEEETPILDPYFQQNADDTLRNHDALLTQKATLTLFLSPRDHSQGIDGTNILHLTQRYGLKYGTLNMFHRYEHPEGRGMLWFSMLGVTIEGDLQPFDLVELPKTTYQGLAFFLSLPHPNALVGFESMTQIAYAIAEELDADIHDQDGYFIDQDQLAALKSDAINYAN